MQTIETLINSVHQRLEAADMFYGHGSDNAWDEAVYLVLAALGLPLDSSREILGQAVTAEQEATVEAWFKRRVDDREPLPYIMNKAYYMGLEFYVDPRVLIPRSLMMTPLANACEPWVDSEQVQRVLEIGTGSGCLAIVAALTFEDAEVDAVDISADALVVAQRNVESFDLQQRVHLFESDCYQRLPKQRYDIIISNPPYVSDDDMAVVPDEYRQEPVLALRADDQGLDIVMRILRGAPDYMTDDAVLFMEVGFSDETMVARFPEAPFVWLDTDAETSGLFIVTKPDLLQFLASLDEGADGE